ncbi:glycosyltransferase family 4 protein [Mucilaginibacter litoreus]|uniref:Glycosyltransferase family 4 protein n=1 Tax=Mucilaginibacter litoreus TaxID=1048221 RepID=A0ABW3ARW3_9SPHI
MKKIKVAFFADILTENLDGAVRTMYQLISRIDTTVFDYLFIYGAGPDTINTFDTFRVPFIKLPVNKGYSLATPGVASSKLKEKLQYFAPDIVHIATPAFLGNFALQYANKTGLPVISIYHTHFISYVDYYLKYLPFFIKPVKRGISTGHKKFYNRCTKVYVPSTSIKAELAGMGVSSTKMQIWKRGVDTTLFNPLNRDKRVLERLTGNTHPTIIFASRLVWEKNLETLIEIYNQVQTQNLPVNFLITGDGSARKACEARMKKAVFTGRVDHHYLASLYASADVFLFPSVSETYGNVVVEAMASGLPCVVADGGGSKDFIDHGVNGFKCSPYNAADYIEKITAIINNRTLAHQFITAGLKYTQQLSWDTLADTYFEDVKSLVPINLQLQAKAKYTATLPLSALRQSG